MTWTKTGTDTYWNVSSSQTSRTVTAGTVGDLRVVLLLTGSSSVSVSALSGGGVSTWARAGTVNSVAATTISFAANAEIWYGKITGTGTALTVTYSGTIGTIGVQGMQRDFRTSRPGTPTYSVQGFAFMQTSGHATASPLTWPSLTTKGTDELVTGDMGNFGGMTSISGSSTGYTYTTDTSANYYIYRLSCGAGEVEAATLTFSGTDGWYAQQAIFDDGLSAPGAGAVTASGQNAGASGSASPSSAAVTADAQNAGASATASPGAAAVAAAAFGATVTAGASPGAGAVTATAYGATESAGQPAGSGQVVASAFNAIARVGVTPMNRVFTVDAESRTILVPAESRVFEVEAESRTIYVDVGDDDGV